MTPTPYIPTTPRRYALAFTLVELLVVIAIIATLAVATLPALRGAMGGMNLNGAGGVAEAELSLGRQTAMSRNLPVEVRIYRHDDGTGDAWRILALLIPAAASGQTADEWLSPGKALPGNVILSDTDDYSTILSEAITVTTTGDKTKPPWKDKESATAPGILKSKDYVGFTFRPDGSANLPSDKPWCLSLKNPNSPPAAGRPAANFVSLIVDPLTGRTILFQP